MTAKRYDSVWDSLEGTPGAVEDMKIRSALVQELAARITKSGSTHSEAAEQYGVTPLLISDLLEGRIDVFNIDALVRMLAEAGLHLDLRVSPSKLSLDPPRKYSRVVEKSSELV